VKPGGFCAELRNSRAASSLRVPNALQPIFVDTNPFLFRGKVCGAMVRLPATPIVNVTSGGGETGFFVLQEQRGT
jgi:hypothetical protein